jgi:glycosyltransferase involved in cell wall biosynthesis
LRIALVHSFYSSRLPSGENAVVESEFKALRRAGYEVELFAAHTDHLTGDVLYPLRAALRVATGRGASPLKAIRSFNPDLVHVHNLFPNFGRRWVEDIGVPLIHTVHNFRTLCANGMLFRDGRVCTQCPDGRRWSGFLHGCYRSSRLATLPSTLANCRGPMSDPVFRRADRLLMLTELQRDIYVRAGVPPEKTTIAPNFLSQDLDPGPPPEQPRSGYIFVGRLSAEKGIRRLLECWPEGVDLRIVGDGPQRPELEAIAARLPNVSLVGQLTRPDVIQAMQRHRHLVFPSRALEGFPLVYPEALACGLAVIAFQPSALADLANRDKTGMAVQWDEPWPELLRGAPQPGAPSPAHCREIFEAHYSESSFRHRIAALLDALNKERQKQPARASTP